VTALIYWGVLTFLPLVVVILAWQDLKELSRTRHQRQAELYRDLANLQQQLQKPREPREGPGTDHKP
jgi:hypothetical protein